MDLAVSSPVNRMYPRLEAFYAVEPYGYTSTIAVSVTAPI